VCRPNNGNHKAARLPVDRHHAGLTQPEREHRNDRLKGALTYRHQQRSAPMTKSGILVAAAVLASALASPAVAQQVVYNPGYCAQFYPNANCQNKGPGNPYTGSYQRQTYRDQAYRDRAWQGSTWQDSNWRNSYNR